MTLFIIMFLLLFVIAALALWAISTSHTEEIREFRALSNHVAVMKGELKDLYGDDEYQRLMGAANRRLDSFWTGGNI